MSFSYTSKFTQFPSHLVCVIQTQLLLLQAAFMGGISMNCVGKDPTQAEDSQNDLVFLDILILAVLADIICGTTLWVPDYPYTRDKWVHKNVQ